MGGYMGVLEKFKLDNKVPSQIEWVKIENVVFK